MTQLTVVRVVTSDDVAAALAVRHEVFVLEQEVPIDLEQDDRDPTADHFLVRLDGRPVGAGRLVIEEPGYEGVDAGLGPVAHLGRLAVTLEVRGTGLGAVLVRAIESRARERGLRVMYLGAQTHAVPFYERLGYGAHGPVFDDAGIPHRHMTRLL